MIRRPRLALPFAGLVLLALGLAYGVEESREDARVLRSSNYRVTGNLTASNKVVRNWLLGTKFKTRKL